MYLRVLKIKDRKLESQNSPPPSISAPPSLAVPHVTSLNLFTAFSRGILLSCKFSGDEKGGRRFSEKM
jgi:hypothetical protein